MGYLRFLFFIIISSGIYRDSLGEKPTLIPLADELTIQEGSELKIQCSSRMPLLHFSFPMHTFMSPRSTHKILNSKNGTLTFLRRRAISLDTGWYACAAEDVEIENDFKILNHTHEDIAWIYVYVSSSDPFADRYYTFPKTIIILAGQPVIVPCRPTSPDLDVQLYRNYYIVNLTMNEQIRFDPKIGFVMEPAKSGNIEDIFQCKINGVEDDYILSYSSATGRRPTMKTVAEELVLREGESLRIDCHGESNIQFVWPKFYEQDVNWGKAIPSNHEIITDGKGTRTFLYTYTVPTNTGWYGCAEEGIDTEFQPYYIDYTRKEINWIYVFVESNTIQLLRGTPVSTTTLKYKDATSVVLPCRPTSRRFDVQLKSESGILELDENLRFNQKLGFVIRRSPSQPVSCYTCVVDKNAHFLQCLEKWLVHFTQVSCTHSYIRYLFDVTVCYLFHKVPKIYSAPSPSITSKQNMLFIGDDLYLKCGAFTETMFRLEWIIPTTISKKRVKFGQIRRLTSDFGTYYTEKMLEIKNFTIHDSGKYICVSRNAKSSLETSEIPLIFDDNSLDYITDLKNLYSLPNRTKYQGQSMRWMINYESPFSDPKSITWSSPSQQISRLKSVTSYNSNKYKWWFSTGKREILEIRNLSFDDSGVYKLTLHNDISLTSKLILDVQGPPIVFIVNGSELHYVAPGREFLTVCNITGSPRPNITWNFVKYPNFPSDKDSFSANVLNSKDVPGTRTNIWISYLNMSTELCGILACTACNSFNCSTATERIIISDGIGRFGIIGPKNPLYFGDNVELTCEGSIYEFQNLSWAEFDESFSKVSQKTFYVEANQTRFTIRLVLSIRNLTKYHQKSYSCIGQRIDNNIENASYNLQLHIPQKPFFTRSNLDGSMVFFDPELADSRTWSLICCAYGDPQPNVTWFKNSLELELGSPKHRFVPSKCELLVDLDPREDNGGRYTCKAENRFGKTENHINFVITAPRKPHLTNSTSDGSMTFFDPESADNKTLSSTSCADGNPRLNAAWFKDDWKLEESSKHRFVPPKCEVVVDFDLREANGGRYRCRAKNRFEKIQNQVDFFIKVSRKPHSTNSTLDGSMISSDRESADDKNVSLICCADENPQPNVTWFKDDLKLEESPKHRFVPSKCELVVNFDLRQDDGGKYTCKAESQFRKTENYGDFVTRGKEAKEINPFITIIVFVSLLINVPVTVLLVRRHRIKKSRRKFKEAILKRFDEGALNYFDPKLDIVDQAELLPYDEKWEYPRELLELGKVLGSGAFGIVRKARAKSIRKEELLTTVAVKMVRATFRLHHMTALSRELKVLLYLGEHVNVVNLLGACTKDVTYGELFVIVEYCRFGNLQDYLFGRRADFINQIDEVTEETIGPHYSTKRVSISQNRVDTDHDCGSETGGSCCSSDSMGTEEEDSEKNPSSASMECSLRTKYEGDYTDTVLDPICTKDLLCWAWQVARGMRYLGRRKVVHGDLAARNILLADRNVIKICDFGMAKALYKDEDQREEGQDLLPLKWMAIESIKNRTFSIESDIWSYGIVLWEFFTLAKSPYPGIHPQFLYPKLVNGYRMDRPEYAPKEIYHMMMKCWDADPTQRPTFEKIENELSDLLDYDAKTYYLELGASYTKIEDEIMETGRKDYLTTDPSEIATVSFSTESDKVEFSNAPSSSIFKNIVPESSFDTDVTLQLG